MHDNPVSIHIHLAEKRADNRNDSPPISTHPPPPGLLDRIREVLRRKHYSYKTEQAYLFWIKRFVLFHHKRHPQEMGAEEVQQFLTHLAVTENVSASTQNRGPRNG
ncbi:phage integrase N-terminal SAM-like domain-containing protein [candidate division KSB1 bacterium]|nr:phage integrase N-terminal SAM-like domain-containing protein [candidate division KSB1 bacterium]